MTSAPYQPSVLGSFDTADVADVAARFWPKVKVSADRECWEWQAFTNGQGYGMLRVVGKMELAHRVSWCLHYGSIPDGLHVLHRCDNPPCVNPADLFLGDNAANVADKVQKGRSSFPQPKNQGERHWQAKLTAAQVSEIRAAYSRGRGRRLARQYDVSTATISLIVNGKAWRDGAGDHRSSFASAAPDSAADGVRRVGD